MGKKESAKKEAGAKKAAAAMATHPAGPAQRPDVDAARKKRSSLAQNVADVAAAVNTTYSNYKATLSGRLKLIDAFLVFLVALGVLQFVYVLLIGNFPFNAFLGGFIACVAQFVLTVSLRMQYALIPQKGGADRPVSDSDAPFSTISPERALGDYVFASLILHFMVFHFIN